MSLSKGKTAGVKRHKKKEPDPLDQLQPGMPAADSITGVEKVRKGKKTFHIIHTSEVDAYESAPPNVPKEKQPRKTGRKHR
jgi:hypothetical protein